MGLKITGIDHIVLRTSKLHEMLQFYCDVLGCPIERQLPPKTGLTQLRAGNALIDIVTIDSELGRVGGGPPPSEENTLDPFCLQLEPVSEQQLANYLKESDIEVSEFTERYGAEGFGRSVYIQDPEGNTVELKPSQP